MDFDRFRAYAESAGLVPVWRDVLLDLDAPVSAFAKLRTGGFGFLLESAPAGSKTWSRYTFMGTDPRSAWSLCDGMVSDWTPIDGWSRPREVPDPLADLELRVNEYAPAAVAELGDFWGGAVGYLGYDVVRAIEFMPHRPPRGTDIPDALFVFTRGLVVLDNFRSQGRLIVSVPIPRGSDARAVRALYDEAQSELDRMEARLLEASPLEPLSLGPPTSAAVGASSYERDRFIQHVEQIKEYIRAGDCFQCLLARCIAVEHDFDSSDLYRALRALNPSPYMFHLDLDGTELVGSSPELLVRFARRRVTVRPIAGTRPRGTTPESDDAMAAELLADEKERAEHVMLVDLGRNDVGRLAEYGTVEVSDFMCVEKYSHVLHIVSQVDGTVRPHTGLADVLRAVFPAGTMTGAPKVRAMQIIDELEPSTRGAYAGAVGYIAWGGERIDLAITIRTCVIANGTASVQAGAGIVADSVPEMEWQETENKARAVLTAIAQVRSKDRSKARFPLGAGAIARGAGR
ncbi:MAG: chorismate-binding protein [Gemmatimonadota bacterium]|nr:chorismate-binding protein [Gemmatimonadota bacterium]